MQNGDINDVNKNKTPTFFRTSVNTCQVPPPMKSPHLQKKDGEKSKGLDDTYERKDMENFPPELYNQVQRQFKR